MNKGHDGQASESKQMVCNLSLNFRHIKGTWILNFKTSAISDRPRIAKFAICIPPCNMVVFSQEHILHGDGIRHDLYHGLSLVSTITRN